MSGEVGFIPSGRSLSLTGFIANSTMRNNPQIPRARRICREMLPPRPSPARSSVPGLPDMNWNAPSLSAPPVPPCAKHVRPGSGGAWPHATENQSGDASPTQNPCRDRPPECPWCRQRAVLRGKPSPTGPGRQPRSVLTEEKGPEAFPSEGKAVRRNCPAPSGKAVRESFNNRYHRGCAR